MSMKFGVGMRCTVLLKIHNVGLNKENLREITLWDFFFTFSKWIKLQKKKMHFLFLALNVEYVLFRKLTFDLVEQSESIKRLLFYC